MQNQRRKISWWLVVITVLELEETIGFFGLNEQSTFTYSTPALGFKCPRKEWD